MKKVIFAFSVIIFFGNFNICVGQNGTEEEMVFMVVEKMPEYPGGVPALRNDIAKNIAYPAKAKENGIEGTVYLRFIVEKDGSIGKVELLSGVDKLLDNEAIRVIKHFKRFKPAMNKGKKVRFWFSIPIKFELKNELENKKQKK